MIDTISTDKVYLIFECDCGFVVDINIRSFYYDGFFGDCFECGSHMKMKDYVRVDVDD